MEPSAPQGRGSATARQRPPRGGRRPARSTQGLSKQCREASAPTEASLCWVPQRRYCRQPAVRSRGEFVRLEQRNEQHYQGYSFRDL